MEMSLEERKMCLLEKAIELKLAMKLTKLNSRRLVDMERMILELKRGHLKEHLVFDYFFGMSLELKDHPDLQIELEHFGIDWRKALKMQNGYAEFNF